MKHLADKLIDVLSSYYTNNLLTNKAPKCFAMQLILQQQISYSDGRVGH